MKSTKVLSLPRFPHPTSTFQGDGRLGRHSSVSQLYNLQRRVRSRATRRLYMSSFVLADLEINWSLTHTANLIPVPLSSLYSNQAMLFTLRVSSWYCYAVRRRHDGLLVENAHMASLQVNKQRNGDTKTMFVRRTLGSSSIRFSSVPYNTRSQPRRNKSSHVLVQQRFRVQ